MKRTVNQSRAIAYHLKQNPNLTLSMGVAGLSIGFKNRVTKETAQVSYNALENSYNHHLRERETQVKSMKKELKDNGHTIKSKPRAIRSPRGGTQISLTGDDPPEGEA